VDRHHGHDDKVILRAGQRRRYEYGRLMEKEHRKRPIIKQTEQWEEKFRRIYRRHAWRNAV
jgi:hypothetical protein